MGRMHCCCVFLLTLFLSTSYGFQQQPPYPQPPYPQPPSSQQPPWKPQEPSTSPQPPSQGPPQQPTNPEQPQQPDYKYFGEPEYTQTSSLCSEKIKSSKPGACPSSMQKQKCGKCEDNCRRDEDCPGTMKCCPQSFCGNWCREIIPTNGKTQSGSKTNSHNAFSSFKAPG